MMGSYIERTIASLIAASERAAISEQLAFSEGVLQRVDPRVKVAGLFALIIVVAASRRVRVIAALFVVAAVLAVASNVRMRRLAGWVWSPVLFFTGAIALPAIFLTPGQPIAVYGVTVSAITEQGLRAAAFLIGRAETASTLSALLVLTTPWPWVLKALRILRCPMIVVAILGMTYRYIFVILQAALEVFEARKSRTVGVLPSAERRRLASSAVGVLLSKSVQMSSEVHLAMRSRGFRGEIHLLHDFRARAAVWCWLAGFGLLAAASLWWGR
jgi:cobalt/nickel transport system permease protein